VSEIIVRKTRKVGKGSVQVGNTDRGSIKIDKKTHPPDGAKRVSCKGAPQFELKQYAAHQNSTKTKIITCWNRFGRILF